MRNITIDGVRQCLRSMNWKDAVVENVTINGKRFPRPGYVRILGVPCIGGTVTASAESCGAQEPLTFCWERLRITKTGPVRRGRDHRSA